MSNLPLSLPPPTEESTYDPYATPINLNNLGKHNVDPFATPIIKEKLTNQGSSSSSSSNTTLYIGIFAIIGILAFVAIIYFWNKYHQNSAVSSASLLQDSMQPTTLFGAGIGGIGGNGGMPDPINLSDLGNLKDLDLI